MAAKLKVDQVESVDGSSNITINNSVTMAANQTLPAASLTGALPAISGASVTSLNATNLGSGTVPTARLGSGTASSSVFLSGAGTWATAGSTSASDLTSGTLPIARIADDAVTLAKMADDAIGVAQLSATGTASSSTFLRGDNAWVAAGGTNTPAFHAYRNATQGIADNSAVKIQFNAESFDTDSAYDHGNNHRFTVPSGKAGKYFIYSQVYHSPQASRIYVTQLRIFKNGSSIRSENRNYASERPEGMTVKITSIEDLAVGDYIEIYFTGNTDPSNSNYIYATDTYFTMFKLL